MVLNAKFTVADYQASYLAALSLSCSLQTDACQDEIC